MEIKIDKSEFSQTKTKMETAVENLRQYHNEQQTVLGDLTSTWKGRGGDSFRDCAREISTQTLMGIFMITTLNTKATTSLSYNETVDRLVASSLAG